jgi:hypothetical protein
MQDELTPDHEAADAMYLLAELARRKGVERLAELGDIPPFRSPEFRAWADEQGIEVDDLLAVEGEEQARELLFAEQRRRDGIVTIPDAVATVETSEGWAFYNATGYLGTVTPEGELIDAEDQGW